MLGVVVGCFVFKALSAANSVGTLWFDSSDSNDGPFLFLEVPKNIDIFRNKKQVTFKIKDKGFGSRS
jgi:hypothetical protein